MKKFLKLNRILIGVFIYGLLIFQLHGQSCPTTEFTFGDDTICLNQTVEIVNQSVNGIEFEWDFCVGVDLNSVPTVTDISPGTSFGLPYDVDLIEWQNMYYAFSTTFSSNGIVRLDFGGSITDTPTVTPLSLSGLIPNPISISIKETTNGFYGFVVDFSNNKLYKLDFGSSLINTPTVTDITSGLSLSSPVSVEAIEDEGEYYVLVVNSGSKRIDRLTFSSGYGSTYTSDTISISLQSDLSDFAYVVECDEKYGFLVSRNGNSVSRLEFGSSLSNTPTETLIASGISLSRPTGVTIFREGNQYHGFLTSRDNDLYHFSFVNGIEANPVGSNLGNISGSNKDWGISSIKEDGEWHLIGGNFGTGKMLHYRFQNECSASVFSSKDSLPTVGYSTEGIKYIGLTSIDNSGHLSYNVDTLVVTSSSAPDISFSISSNQCISNSNTFTSSNVSGNIISYSWDFDGDGVEDSTDPNPTYQFAEAGTYEVRLTVESDEGCTNYTNESISIYPEPPTPVFNIDGSLCSNNQLDFTVMNDLSSFSGIIEYDWNFNGEYSSQLSSSAYTFSNPGEKNIRLTLTVPNGCSTFSEQIITIGSGAIVDFEWTNNCYGDSVHFINNSSGENITNYLWDFGDGGTSLGNQPKYLYSEAGDYIVSLTVENSDGCQTTLDQQLSVNDQDLIAINYGTAIQNIPLCLTAIDLTHSSDSIIHWDWDFGDQTISESDFSPCHIYEQPGDFTINLNVETAQGCLDSITEIINVITPKCPTVDFSVVSDTICLNQTVGIVNQSVNGIEFEWDFCVGVDLNSVPTVTEISPGTSFGLPYDVDLIEWQNMYYAFSTTFSSNGIVRLDFGGSITDTPTVTPLSLSGLIPNPISISIKETTNGFYGFVVDFSNNKLYKLDFGSSLINTPTVTDITSGLSLSSPVSVEAIEDEGEYYVLVVNSGSKRIDRLTFSSGYGSTYISDTISISLQSDLSDFAYVVECDEKYGFLVSRNGNSVSRLEFGSSLSNTPTETLIASGISLSRPTGVTIFREGNQYHGFLTSRDNDLYHFSFVNGIEANPVGSNLGNLNGFDKDWGISSIKEDGEWHLIGGNFGTGKMLHYRFQNECSASVFSSKDSLPTVSYSTEGVKYIGLTSIDNSGHLSYNVDTLVVSPSTAPDISFSISSNQCISNPNTFTSSNVSGNIISYSWDFDGDGIEDSTDPNPTFQFAEAGTYEVRLSVESDEGCGNFAQESITIYPEPPVPVFTVPKDSFCVGEPVVISNLTDDVAWDGIVEYVWTVTDLTDTTTTAPELTFGQPGEKIIRVVSKIPGCESIAVTDTVQVIESPVVDFTADPVCDGETTIFTNISGMGTILWDFGDGNTSTELNPTHTFATPNTYSVSLAVTNDLECTTTLVKEVAVNAIPQANFQYDLVCAGSESIFEDMSVVDQADISSWQWLVDGELVSEEQFPTIMFEEAKDYVVRLIAGSTKGCESFYEEVVTVGAAPDAGIGIELGCLGEPTVFTDLTDPTEVLTRSWMIDGQPYTDESPSVTFNEPGDYEVELTVTNNQLCSSIITETFTIHELAVPDFTISGQCNNEIIRLEDVSVSATDPIISRNWFIDGNPLGQGASVSISGYLPGTYDFTLEVTTENGCVVSSDQAFEIVETPVASFTASNDYGVPPFRLEFNNTSQMASVNEWYVNDALITTNPSPSIVFNDSGSQHVRLITYNSTGCADTAELYVNAIEPVVDIALTDVQLVEDGNNYDIVLDVKNSSNLPIEAMSVSVELQNQFTVSEQIYQRINSGEESIVMLGTSVPKSSNAPAYLCISISTAYEEAPAKLSNNEACITIEPKINFEPPYPNPATTETSLRYILPEGGEATIEVYDVGGNLEILQNFEDLPEGLNQFTLNVSNLDAGTYLVKFRYNGSVIVSKIIKL